MFADQSYWQSAVAASPAKAVVGFLAGGMVWWAELSLLLLLLLLLPLLLLLLLSLILLLLLLLPLLRRFAVPFGLATTMSLGYHGLSSAQGSDLLTKSEISRVGIIGASKFLKVYFLHMSGRSLSAVIYLKVVGAQNQPFFTTEHSVVKNPIPSLLPIIH